MSNSKKHKRVEYSLEFHFPPGTKNHARTEIRQFIADTPFAPIHVGDRINPYTLKFDGEEIAEVEKELGSFGVGASEIVVDRIEHQLIDSEDHIWNAVWVFTKRVPS